MFGQRGYINQTKKYIINEFSDCLVSEYTDSSVAFQCKPSPVDAYFYFNKDGICDFSIFYYNKERIRILQENLLSEGYTKSIQEKNGEYIYKYKLESCKTTMISEIGKQKEDLFFCSFYKLKTSTMDCDK